MSEERVIHFVSGLPRSGSTLLCNILAQNPRFHVTETSGILEILFSVRNRWDNVVEFKAAPDDEAKLRVLRAILFSYHKNGDKPIIFDKSRGWLAYLEMAEAILGRKAKVLVPVRDIRDVLASFEKLFRKNAAIFQPAPEADQRTYFDWQTLEGRCRIWADKSQPVGLAYNRVKDALQRKFGDRMHFVRYEMLTSKPEETMKDIYTFLGEEPFQHDFNYVEQVTEENDFVHGFRDLHKIKPKVEPQPPQWPTILGKQVADLFEGTELW